MTNFDPKNGYYQLRTGTTQVFSSARGQFVGVTDAAYQSWLAEGNFVIPVDSAQEIGAALATFLVRPSDATVLDGYIGTQADKVLTKLEFKIAFNHESRLRALEGKAPLTVAQARNFVKGLM